MSITLDKLASGVQVAPEKLRHQGRALKGLRQTPGVHLWSDLHCRNAGPRPLKVRVPVMAQSPQRTLPGPGRPAHAAGAAPAQALPAQTHANGQSRTPHPSPAGPVRLTVGSSHLPPASHAVQPDGSALGEGQRPEAG